MKRPQHCTWLVALAALAWISLPAVASAQAQEQPPMTPEQQRMMEAWTKAGTPGKQHQWLASKAGSWNFAGKFWMESGKPPTESSGTVERTTMLGGRVVAEKVASPGFMGQPFEGYGLTGYDNVTQKFWGSWTDNMSTAMMMSTGTCDDQGACTFSGQYPDAMTGQMKTMRMVSRDEGPDKEVHEAFETGPDGKEYKSMELVYTRKK